MVWFQCEDCGENLKKPKLPNHFRMCSATKLSCIDCGQMFSQQAVQGHTQCMTEMEKYGPKGPGTTPNSASTTAKLNRDAKQKPEFDIHVGLSQRAPWSCSLCNTKVTSQETLLLHAEGKKHRTKARGFHAANQPPKQAEESAPAIDVQTEKIPKSENKKNEEEPQKDLPKVDSSHQLSDGEKGKLSSKKKRKVSSGEADNGEVIQVERTERENAVKKVKSDSAEEMEKNIKWKKLITSALKSNPDGVLKMRKLKKLVLESLQESGITLDENQLSDTLQHKVCSSSRFSVDNKLVRLVTKD